MHVLLAYVMYDTVFFIGMALLSSLRSSLFHFLSGKRKSREGTGARGHAFARLPLGSRFLPLRRNGKDCYAD